MKRILLVVLASLLVGLGSVESVEAQSSDLCDRCIQIACKYECQQGMSACGRCARSNCATQCGSWAD